MGKKTEVKAIGILRRGSDGHKRITRGENLLVVGGSKEQHEIATELTVKIQERFANGGDSKDPAWRTEVTRLAQELAKAKD